MKRWILGSAAGLGLLVVFFQWLGHLGSTRLLVLILLLLLFAGWLSNKRQTN
jgi:hypothetical protein